MASDYINSYVRQVNKNEIPVCNILGVNIAAVNMNWLIQYLTENINAEKGNRLTGDYICVSNVHTTVTSYENDEYCRIQNNALMALPDGGPLSAVGQKRGCTNICRITGPDLMHEIFKISPQFGYRHYFYGSTVETLDKLNTNLKRTYEGIEITGMYSPSFHSIQPEDDSKCIAEINRTNSDFVWIGLGAPKQEYWMSQHQGKINGVMIGVGAGFDYFAGNIHRAPKWMQKNNLEWFYRLMQEPVRLFNRYLKTNTKFIWNAIIKGK